MKCEDCLAIIEEYFDAELAERESQQVAEHLTACSLCNEVYESLQQEQQLYVHYQRDVEITSALWQGVQASIKSEAAHQAERTPSVSLFDRARQFFGEAFHAPRFSPALAAMLVVAAIGATVLVMNYVNSHSNSTNVAGTIQNGNVATPSNDANANHSSQTGVVAGSNSNTNPKDAPEKDNHEIVAPEKNQLAKNSNACSKGSRN
jgi:anti-sigma factor RsiW